MSLRNNNPNSVINGRCSIAIVERVYL
jgi:hypothetical protein